MGEKGGQFKDFDKNSVKITKLSPFFYTGFLSMV